MSKSLIKDRQLAPLLPQPHPTCLHLPRMNHRETQIPASSLLVGSRNSIQSEFCFPMVQTNAHHLLSVTRLGTVFYFHTWFISSCFFRFYVNTTANPPVTTWVHPLGPAPPPGPPPAPYSPPAGPPPPTNTGYNQGGGGGQGYGYSNPQGGYSPGCGGGGNNCPQQQRPPYNRYDGGSSPQNWQQPPQQAQQGGKGMMGSLISRFLAYVISLCNPYLIRWYAWRPSGW